jgi:hypothetical protein
MKPKNIPESMEIPPDTVFPFLGLQGNGKNHVLEVKWVTLKRYNSANKPLTDGEFYSRKLNIFQFHRQAILYRLHLNNGEFYTEDILMEI